VAQGLFLGMFIRKRKNKSGSYSVHIVRKEGRRQVLVKSVGAATEGAELRKLELTALQEMAKIIQQSSMDFNYSEDERYLQRLRDSIQAIRIVGPELILGKIFNEVGFNRVGDRLFRHLVLSRICYPGSKLKTVEYLLRHHQEFYDIDAVYRYLDKLHKDHKEQLQTISYQHTLQLFGGVLSVMFYDVTTLYFEASEEDDLRKIGFSKDGKAQHPQIVLGLLVSTGGYPLAFEMFEGNRFEGQTMLPVIEKFKNKYGLNDIIVVADAGLLSDENIAALIKLNYGFILGARIKNEAKAIRKEIQAQTWVNGQTHIISKSEGMKLIVSYSQARAANDKHNRERGLQRLEKLVKKGKLTKGHINNRGYNKYLMLEGDIDISINYQKFKEDARWDGLKGYLTNTALTAINVIDSYKQLWQIEKAFRISKTDLKVRPIYHRLRHRIEAHLIIAFCSYKIYKELERQLRLKQSTLSPEKAIEIMQSIFAVQTTLPASNKPVEIIMAKTEEQQHLLRSFEINF
jgi:transposase